MPQNVPPFEWTEDALRLRAFVYEFWCRTGRGPTLGEVHDELGLDRRAIIGAYKQLQLGLICVVDPDTQNCNVLKFQPFSSFPSQVRGYIDGDFHSFVGCAMEAMAFGQMPPFSGRDVGIESWCACCFEPISFHSVDGEITEREPDDFLVHVSRSPYFWNNVDIVSMCDAMNFVIDAEHAVIYEQQMGVRGVLFTLEQAQWFTSATAAARMHDYHWPPGQLDPAAVVKIVAKLGVDTTSWGLPPR
jgi:hypothetical protein